MVTPQRQIGKAVHESAVFGRIDDANLPHPRTIAKAPTVFTEWTPFIGVIAASTSGWDAGGVWGVEIGAALSRVGLESGPNLTMAFVS